MNYFFLITIILALTSGHSGAAFLIASGAFAYHAKTDTGARLDMVAGSLSCALIAMLMAAVESF